MPHPAPPVQQPITLDIDDDLLALAQDTALRQGITLGQAVSQ
ncbi:MAG: hypothetical protein Q4F13_00960 [Pseudomonadota bacterium]|nr:hypothetical protein [Pseudomonadota bacterium]